MTKPIIAILIILLVGIVYRRYVYRLDGRLVVVCPGADRFRRELEEEE